MADGGEGASAGGRGVEVAATRSWGARLRFKPVATGLAILTSAAGLAAVVRASWPHPPARRATVLPILDPPVLRANFPDPFLMRTDRGFLAFATQTGRVHVQVAASSDLLHWSLLNGPGNGPADALPRLPAWVRADRPDVWAPEVMRFDRTYVLYFSARSRLPRPGGDGDTRECVGAATSATPTGPFVPLDRPLICAAVPSGAIDPSPFRDGRRLYLYFKRDGNCCHRGSGILVQDLAPDGLSVSGARERTGVRNDEPWEGRVVEAPTMLKRDGRYIMFYSGAFYGGAAYAIGYADCRSPTGRCRDAPENPILASRQARPPRLIGPGHQSILQAGGRTFIAYHAWEVLPGGGRGSRRFMHISEVLWRRGRPVISGLQRPMPAFAPTPVSSDRSASAHPLEQLARRVEALARSLSVAGLEVGHHAK